MIRYVFATLLLVGCGENVTQNSSTEDAQAVDGYRDSIRADGADAGRVEANGALGDASGGGRETLSDRTVNPRGICGEYGEGAVYIPCCLEGQACGPETCSCADNVRSQDPTAIYCVRMFGPTATPTVCYARKQ